VVRNNTKMNLNHIQAFETYCKKMIEFEYKTNGRECVEQQFQSRTPINNDDFSGPKDHDHSFAHRVIDKNTKQMGGLHRETTNSSTNVHFQHDSFITVFIMKNA